MRNLNEIDNDDGIKKVQPNWCLGSQTSKGEWVEVSGWEQPFMEGKAKSTY
jgi:hypothetical protein